MFLDYKSVYQNAYKILNSELNSNTISHAYLFEINNKNDYKFIYAFIKQIFANNSNFNFDKISKQIDSNTYENMYIVETDLKVIKKEQIIELKTKLKNCSTNSNCSIYIIKDSNKMNSSSTNTLLKFLEEPQDNIIGILTTNNIYNVLPTILSRCQIISLKDKKQETKLDFKKYIDKVLELVYSIDKYEFDSISLIPNFFREMEYNDINDFLNTLLFLYRDLLNCSISNQPIYFTDYEDLLKKVNIKNVNILSKRISTILNLIEDNNSNMNKNMLFDKMIIELIGDVHDVKC